MASKKKATKLVGWAFRPPGSMHAVATIAIKEPLEAYLKFRETFPTGDYDAQALHKDAGIFHTNTKAMQRWVEERERGQKRGEAMAPFRSWRDARKAADMALGELKDQPEAEVAYAAVRAYFDLCVRRLVELGDPDVTGREE